MQQRLLPIVLTVQEGGCFKDSKERDPVEDYT